MTEPTLQTHPAQVGHDKLLQTLQHHEAAVRREPMRASHRWALLETLCLLCQWQRALQQLQAWARLNPQGVMQAQALRGLIQAESQRTQVFSGHLQPSPVIEATPWMALLWQALQHNAQGELAQADECRHMALDQAPSLAGTCHWQSVASPDQEAALQSQAFEWLCDSDTRLGPVCELMAAGAYRWLPFADIATLTLSEPQRRLDLIWTPATLTLRGPAQANKAMHVFIPARSCWLSPPAEPNAQQQAQMQARLTVWTEVGSSGVFSHGQKTWMAEGIDWPLLDVRHIHH